MWNKMKGKEMTSSCLPLLVCSAPTTWTPSSSWTSWRRIWSSSCQPNPNYKAVLYSRHPLDTTHAHFSHRTRKQEDWHAQISSPCPEPMHRQGSTFSPGLCKNAQDQTVPLLPDGAVLLERKKKKIVKCIFITLPKDNVVNKIWLQYP